MKKREFFERLIEVMEGVDVEDKELLIEKLNHEIELLNKKNSRKTQTRTQIENQNIKVKILEVLKSVDKPITISELQSASEDMAQYSNQKLSALLKQLKDDNQVIKTIDKKKSYFSVA